MSDRRRRRFTRLALLVLGSVLVACTGTDDPVLERATGGVGTTQTTARAPTPPRIPPRPAPSARAPLVGAHTYNWFPANWAQGVSRDPLLGRYSSADPKVAERHIAWASAHGIDFFTLDWWPTRPDQDDVIRRGFLRARNRSDVRFCIFYEAWALGYVEQRGVTPIDGELVRRFTADLVHLARTYFGEPNYLRLGGRPVIVVYLTRTMVGDVAGLVRTAREALRAAGHDAFLVADEIHWRERLMPTRASQFDALTAYTVYDPGNRQHEGHGSQTSLVPDINALYEQYRRLTGGRVPIAPSVVPGYNDRGVRPAEGHFVLPRQWAPGGGEGSLLGELLDRTAYPNLDGRAPLLFLTTWNEWNEDTAIEPTSSAGSDFAPLRAVRDRVAAVAGRVLQPNGRPARGVPVFGWRRGRVVAGDRTDLDGRYLLRRAQAGPGPLLVGLGSPTGARRVMVDARRTVTVELRGAAR